MKFDRWGPPSSDGRSLAYFGFQVSFTEINSAYWGGLPGSILTKRLVKASLEEEQIDLALGVQTPDIRRVGTTMGELDEKFREAERLRRLGTIVSLLSGLEVLITSLTDSAERSDPLLGYRPNSQSDPVDGFPLHVSGRFVLSIPENSFTRGTWPERVARLCHYFSLDEASFPELSRLERARSLRNAFAHELGRPQDRTKTKDLSVMLGVHLVDPVSVSEKWLKELFRDAGEFARYIDQELVSEHIGSFEPLSLYHEWLRSPVAVSKRLGYSPKVKNPVHHGVREFRKVIHHAFRDSGRTPVYFEGLRDYYHSCTP